MTSEIEHNRIIVSLSWHSGYIISNRSLSTRTVDCGLRTADNENQPTTTSIAGADLGEGCGRCTPSPEVTCGFLIQLVFYKKKTMWFIGVEVEQETSSPPPKKHPGSAPAFLSRLALKRYSCIRKLKTSTLNSVYVLPFCRKISCRFVKIYLRLSNI